MSEKSDGAWFAAHRWGIGVGMPVAWQGWLLMAGQIAAASWGVIHFAGNEDAQVIAVLLVVFVPFPLMAAKVRGGWRWRWGGRD